MQQRRFIGRQIVVTLGVIAMACLCYLILVTWSRLDFIWGYMPLIAKAEKGIECGDFDGALRFADRAVQCRPNFWFTYYTRARVFEARGSFREALRDYAMADSFGYYDGFADRHDTLVDRGRIYEKLGELDKAAAAYCVALREGRSSDRSSIVRGVAFTRVMRPFDFSSPDEHPDIVPSLLKFFNDAIKREPDNRDLRECRELIQQSEAK